jgi:hypothetical protein
MSQIQGQLKEKAEWKKELEHTVCLGQRIRLLEWTF